MAAKGEPVAAKDEPVKHKDDECAHNLDVRTPHVKRWVREPTIDTNGMNMNLRGYKCKMCGYTRLFVEQRPIDMLTKLGF